MSVGPMRPRPPSTNRLLPLPRNCKGAKPLGLVDGRTRGQGYAKAVTAPANGVKYSKDSSLEPALGQISYPKAYQRVR